MYVRLTALRYNVLNVLARKRARRCVMVCPLLLSGHEDGLPRPLRGRSGRSTVDCTSTILFLVGTSNKPPPDALGRQVASPAPVLSDYHQRPSRHSGLPELDILDVTNGQRYRLPYA
ncbi:hypothetical protein NUW54_g5648 [Trametes sanguinea]|uniref:Uncharacterized protein n=1 Tax=Trametes sanguinea TaxID=158606 RepID=A0ACC1PV13_9APHY|nr:hypothetical protein NUW54_g5648 [Trametes sanguinea]